METGYGETMRNHDSGKYLPVAMSYLSSSLMLPQRSVHTIASWLEAERGGRGACHEVRGTALPAPITAAASVWPDALDRHLWRSCRLERARAESARTADLTGRMQLNSINQHYHY